MPSLIVAGDCGFGFDKPACYQQSQITISTKSNGERLTIVCEEEPRKTILVKSHIRVINGKIVHVKAYRRKR